MQLGIRIQNYSQRQTRKVLNLCSKGVSTSPFKPQLALGVLVDLIEKCSQTSYFTLQGAVRIREMLMIVK